MRPVEFEVRGEAVLTAWVMLLNVPGTHIRPNYHVQMGKARHVTADYEQFETQNCKYCQTRWQIGAYTATGGEVEQRARALRGALV
jgi:hypothetical protein